jgi:hypothetical protein
VSEQDGRESAVAIAGAGPARVQGSAIPNSVDVAQRRAKASGSVSLRIQESRQVTANLLNVSINTLLGQKSLIVKAVARTSELLRSVPMKSYLLKRPSDIAPSAGFTVQERTQPCEQPSEDQHGVDWSGNAPKHSYNVERMWANGAREVDEFVSGIGIVHHQFARPVHSFTRVREAVLYRQGQLGSALSNELDHVSCVRPTTHSAAWRPRGTVSLAPRPNTRYGRVAAWGVVSAVPHKRRR